MPSAFFDLVPIGYATLCAEGRLVEANLALAEMLGLTREQLVGQIFSAFLHPECRDGFGLRPEAPETGEGRQVRELRMQRRDGTTFWARLEGVTGSDGKNDSAVTRVAVSDVTARREAEDERRELEAQLWQAQKLESLGVLAGGVAHDFNNLLQAMISRAELALMDLPPSSPVREHVEAIEKAAEHAAGLAAQMLAYSGKGRFVVESLDPSSVVAAMTPLLRSTAGKCVEMRFDLPAGLPAIKGDVTQIRQVILSLVQNAAEAIGESGGKIRISARVRDCDEDFLRKTYVVDHLPAGRYVCLEVEDTGSGIDKATLSKIFEPFFTTKFTGRGLGLAALLGIVRGHNGAIRVDSEPGRGTTVQVFLPAWTRVAEPHVQVPPTALPDSTHGAVLVIDDDAGVRIVIEKMLQDLGFDALMAKDGQEGIEALRRHGDDVRLVLLDVQMPRMGGAEALPELRRIKQDVKVMLMSADSEKEISKRFAAEGLAGFLFKPFRKDDLKREMQRALGETFNSPPSPTTPSRRPTRSRP